MREDGYMDFSLDERLSNSTIELANWQLSKVLFKNEVNYAWFLLVPQINNLSEFTDLKIADQQQLLEEINRLSKIIQTEFKPDKINIATLGNQVSQLHVHIVGRFKTDPLWPESIWQKNYVNQAYTSSSFDDLLTKLKKLF